MLSKNIIRFQKIIIIFFYFILLFICIKDLYAEIQKKVLIVCTESTPDGFDVVQYNSLITTNASADVIFDSLVSYDETQKKIVPSLAKKWEIRNNDLTYVFFLRKNVKFQTTKYFSPTRFFNADDVIFTFDRMLNNKNPWHKVSGPSGFPHAESMQLKKLIKSISKIDNNTVKFNLTEKNSTFLAILSMGFTSIYSEEYAKKLLKLNKQNFLNIKPIGTGPFILKKYIKDEVIRYKTNLEYWGKKPLIDNLIYAITPDSNIRMQKIKTGECHIALSPKPQNILNIEKNKNLKIVKTPGFMTSFIALNTEKELLQDKKVRQAINMAFNKSRYLKIVFENTAIQANNTWPLYIWGDNKSDFISYNYNILKAKKIFSEINYSNKFIAKIWFRSSSSLLNPNPKVGAELLQSDLLKIGIKSKIQAIDWAELIKKSKLGEHDILFMGWSGDNGDPDNYLSPLFSCSAIKSGTNFSRYCNTKLDNLINIGKKEKIYSKRINIYKSAQKIIHDEALWIPLGYPLSIAVIRSNIYNYKISPFGRQNFINVKRVLN